MLVAVIAGVGLFNIVLLSDSFWVLMHSSVLISMAVGLVLLPVALVLFVRAETAAPRLIAVFIVLLFAQVVLLLHPAVDHSSVTGRLLLRFFYLFLLLAHIVVIIVSLSRGRPLQAVLAGCSALLFLVRAPLGGPSPRDLPVTADKEDASGMITTAANRSFMIADTNEYAALEARLLEAVPERDEALLREWIPEFLDNLESPDGSVSGLELIEARRRDAAGRLIADFRRFIRR